MKTIGLTFPNGKKAEPSKDGKPASKKAEPSKDK